MARLRRLGSRLSGLPPRLARAPKVALPFYKSKDWRDLVARLIAKRGRRCEAKGCGQGGRIYADHVVEIRDGGSTLDERNIQLLCAKCHGVKTEAARRRRAGLV